MKSMTGFGRGAKTGEEFSVSVEIKTVNNRFLDVNLRISNELQMLESLLKRKISSRLSRGRVDVNLTFERTNEVVYELNRPMIAGYVRAMKQMQEEFSLSGEPDLNVIARLPNALQTAKNDLPETTIAEIENALDLALDELEKMREIEGETLKIELNSRLDEIENQLPVIEENVPLVVENYQIRLNKRITELLAKNESQIELDQARIAQEVAYLADKSDISEEISRLKSHISQFRETLDSDVEIGKRLDFLSQELNREANTILSKATDLTIKEAGLTIKTEIEKIREQVQNVE